ncbi:purine-cytosine permease family protein [Simiduia agarivorans]|uniref:Uncharacterized protein n=1 Tax=Simiduia agarivorans (strain DSM 21679 / JCM 13881 / BCRC 17597 / SA1) TaxID=1117647 RepID=K4KQN7_SIMAS|nr:membrane protein [Simiduia agarivorans]AFV00439.1 hypothetical protein M5M_16540 [Simiduia agarivorans SA1 = DSM 21679]
MSVAEKLSGKLDAVNEYEREPVPEKKVKGFKSFLGLVSGEHIAGTEFVIGPLFVLHGTAWNDLFWGLLVGNILATLSWVLLCAPTAVKTRLTIYYQLEKIAGFNLVSIFNFLNGLLFCVAAAAMIGVSGTAIGYMLGVDMPGLTDLMPGSFDAILIVFAIGVVMALVSTWGYDFVSKFSLIFAPWMPFIFLGAGIAMLPQLGLTQWSDFWTIAETKIWTGVPVEGQSKYGFWHVLIFAWLCNSAMHIGLSDMTIYRYAKKPHYGIASAAGMFIGHFMAWVASGILCAVAIQAGNNNPSSGEIAVMSIGIAGGICVLIAGWTTANPTVYRAGIAVQALFPNFKRWKITLGIGLLATVLACFPWIISKLDQFLGFYALVAAPVGAMVLADVWLFPKLGLVQNFADFRKISFNYAVASAWVLSIVASYGLYVAFDADFFFFMALPAWLIAGALYVVFAKLMQNGVTESPAAMEAN